MLTRAEIPGLVCTAVLIALGVCLAVWQWRSWKRTVAVSLESALPLWPQHLRRMNVAALIVIEGLLLCCGDTVLPVLQRLEKITPRQMALLWTVDVLLILGVAFWLALLALGDLASTVARNRRERTLNRQQARTLCDEIERFHQTREDPQF